MTQKENGANVSLNKNGNKKQAKLNLKINNNNNGSIKPDKKKVQKLIKTIKYDKFSPLLTGIKKNNKPKPSKKKVEIIRLNTKKWITGFNNFAPKKTK